MVVNNEQKNIPLSKLNYPIKSARNYSDRMRLNSSLMKNDILRNFKSQLRHASFNLDGLGHILFDFFLILSFGVSG